MLAVMALPSRSFGGCLRHPVAAYSSGSNTADQLGDERRDGLYPVPPEPGGPSADGIEWPVQAERPAETHRATRD